MSTTPGEVRRIVQSVSSAFGRWDCLKVNELSAVMSTVTAPWWFTGRHALELHLGRSWREHDDIDIGVCRMDIGALHGLVPSWELQVAADGNLHAWDGTSLSSDRHENNLWVRRPGGTWAFDIVIGDGDRDRWRYRRDPTFSLPWNLAVLQSPNAVPYLAPALQLLFKSVDPRPKDHVDAEVVIPTLDAWSLALLDVRLLRGHPWLGIVAAHRHGMQGPNVHDILDLLHRADVTVSVDGGWGIDALLGEQTRPHGDLDLAIPTRHWSTALAALASESFLLVRDDGPHNAVFGNEAGLLVDLHAYDDSTTVTGPDGIARQGPNGLAYEADGFCGSGIIDGRPVACMSAEFQMRSHTGYDFDADDRRDVIHLHQRFAIPLPAEYQS